MDDSVDEEIRELRTLFWSERDPEGRAFAPLADAYRRQGDLDQALELLEDGLGRHSSFTPGHIVAAWVRRDRGEIDAAGDAFGAALALDEENAEALRGLGEIAVERGDGATATVHYRKLTELEPDDLEIVARLREIEMSPPVPRMDPGMAPAEDAVPAFEAAEPSQWQVEQVDAASAIPEAAHATEDFALEDALPMEVVPTEVEFEAPPAPTVEDPEPTGAAPAEPEMDDDGPITRTMADLYARQGLHERALRVYSRLLERAPGDPGLEERVSAMAAAVEAAEAEAAPSSWPTQPGQSDVPRAVEKPGSRRPSDADVETLARDWAEGPRATGELSTPFAWTAKATKPTEAAPPDEVRPVREYFRSLLEWEPAEIVSVAPLAAPMALPMVEPELTVPVVESEAPMPIVESVAPMPIVESVAPMPVVESVAPMPIVEIVAPMPIVESEAELPAVEEAEPPIAVIEAEPQDRRAVVSIESLAPERVVVPIESLAPLPLQAAGIVSIESLAPVVVDIASLAP